MDVFVDLAALNLAISNHKALNNCAGLLRYSRSPLNPWLGQMLTTSQKTWIGSLPKLPYTASAKNVIHVQSQSLFSFENSETFEELTTLVLLQSTWTLFLPAGL